MVSQFGSLGYTIMGRTADLTEFQSQSLTLFFFFCHIFLISLSFFHSSFVCSFSDEICVFVSTLLTSGELYQESGLSV